MTKWMKAALAACLTAGALALVACGGDTITSTTAEAPPPTVAAAPAPTASNPAPNPAPNPNPSPTPETGENPGYEIEFENFAGFKVTNKTDIGQEYRAYTTSFDNQEAELAHQLSGTVPPNESWGGSFNATCVQLDITQFGYAGLPLKGGAAFFDKDGRQFNPSRSPEKVAECRTTPCVPEWRRSEQYEVIYGPWSGPGSSEDSFSSQTAEEYTCGTRTVTYRYTETNSCTRETRTVDVKQKDETKECEEECEEEWIAQEPVKENVGEWGQCEEVKGNDLNFGATGFEANTQTGPQYTQCQGQKSRSYDEVVYEVNSCTQQRREKSRKKKTETTSCEYQCLAAVCHTENKKYCGEKWIKVNGDWGWHYTCENQDWNNITKPDPVKKWQCQNVPPGTPGHWDNHFDKNGHDDFFGSCGPVGGTSEKCYNITN